MVGVAHVYKKENLSHVVKEVYDHAVKKENGLAAFAGARSKLVSGYHDDEHTGKIHLSTIPSHGKNEAGSLSHKMFDTKHMAEHAPMLDGVLSHMFKDKRDGNPLLKNFDLKTYPHAELGALYKFEAALKEKYPNKTPEERRRMALNHFDESKLKTYGSRERGEPAAQQPCDYLCSPMLKYIKIHKASKKTAKELLASG